MNDLNDYKVDKKTLNKENVIKYWVRLYPECKSKEEVEEIIERISNKSLEDFWKDYEEENKVLLEIKETFNSLKNDDYMKYINHFCEKKRQDDKWVYFYLPVLYQRTKKLYIGIQQSELIADSEEALEGILNNIADTLSDVSYRVLVQELQIASEENRLKGQNSKERGEYFSSQLLKNREYVEALYLSYPELYKVMERMVSYSVEYILEILENTEKEYSHIKDKLQLDEMGKLKKIHLGSGDTHDCGRTVAQLYFEGGISLMYKPRSFEMEEGYQKLVDWLSWEIPDFYPLQACKTYSIEGAGWAEFVENLPCETKQQVQQFYKRMGQLLCVLHTLNAKDFHCENVIAKGEYPMLIDVETLIHANILEEEKKQSVEEEVYDILTQGVHTTALLPTLLQNYQTNEVMEVGAICSGRKRKSPFKARVLKRTENDELVIETEQKEIPLDKNLPIYNGDKIGGNQYFKEVRDSFISTYKWVLEHKELYISKLYELFSDVECRVLCKTTNNYTQLLQTSYHPDLLHNKVDREVYFHRLGILRDKTEKNQNLYQDELDAMLQGDIPVYHMLANATEVYNVHHEIAVNLRESPFTKIEKKIHNMSELDLKRQISFLYFSYMGCKMDTDLLEGTNVKFVESKSVGYQYDLLKEACNIADEIQRRAVYATVHGKRHITWMSYTGMGEETYEIVPVGWNLYKGNCGIALYFLRLAQMTGKQEYFTFAKDILNSVEALLINLDEQNYKVMGAGAFTGITGYLYVCSKMMQMGICTEKEKIKKINVVLDKIEQYIQDEERLDVLSGIAGTLGVLTTLYPHCSQNTANKIKAIMKQIVPILLQKAVSDKSNGLTWFDNGDIGYVHGNAGIIAHLARANTILQDEKIAQCIQMALNYERSQYNQEKDVWKLRENTHYFSWCNGIGGMALSKIMLCQSGMETPILKNEIRQMCRQLIQTGFGYDASLCHGDMGTLCILKYIAQFTGDKELEQHVYQTTQMFVKDMLEKQQMFLLENWGLMTGLAGIGLGMLEQLSDMPYLASILCLE